MEIDLICRYCNHHFKMGVWTTKGLKVRCPVCNDKDIKIIEKDEKIDIYKTTKGDEDE